MAKLNGAPLVAFYDTLGIRGRILDLNPRRPHGGGLHANKRRPNKDQRLDLEKDTLPGLHAHKRRPNKDQRLD